MKAKRHKSCAGNSRDDAVGTGGAQLEALYVRSEQMAGRPLTNAFDYGQTVVNDFGRANRQGQNVIAGIEARADSRWFLSGVRVEYQQSGADSNETAIVENIDGKAAAEHWDCGRSIEFA